MTDQKPTGVFVRLPLSNEQIGKLLAPIGTLNERMLAIGTPVTGGDAPIIDYSEYVPEYHCHGMGCGLEDRGIHDRYEAMAYGWDQAMERVCSEFPDAIRQSDAQPQIAALEAEIMRLRGVLEEIELGIDALSSEEDDGGRMASSEMKRQALEVVRSEIKVLKGGAE